MRLRTMGHFIFRINGIGGRLCTVNVWGGGTGREVQHAIRMATRMSETEYMLFDGTRELRASDKLATFFTRCDDVQELSMVRRDPEQAVLAAVEENGDALEHACTAFRGDKEIVMVALSNFGDAFRWASKELREDKQVVIQALRTNPNAIEYISQTYWNDRDVVDEAIRHWERFKSCLPIDPLLRWAHPDFHERIRTDLLEGSDGARRAVRTTGARSLD